MEPGIQMHLKQLKPYFDAFNKTHLANGMKQREIADHCNIRASTLSNLFQYFRGKEESNLTVGALVSLYHKLKAGCDIGTGYIVLSGRPIKKKDDKHVITPHKNYNHSRIGQAVIEGGEDVYMLNTYISYRVFEEEEAKDDEGTLHNWIVRQKKKVRLLLLRPDGKAMRLRIKADLGNSSKLTNHIIDGLETAFELQKKYPDQLEIRLMDELPGLTCVILNERLFYGLHYSFGHAENGPVFEINDPNHFTYSTISNHFKTFWESEERSQKLTESLLSQIKSAVQIVNTSLDYLLGEWDVFIHDMQDVYNGEGHAPSRKLKSSIEKFNLYIDKDYRDIYPRAVITLPNLERLTASLIVERLGDRDYAHIRFKDHTRLSIHLTIHCRFDGKKMYGCFTMSSQTDCCTGVICLNKKEQGITLLPASISDAWKRELAFCEGSFISLHNMRENIATFEGPFKYAGVYKVYSYGGNNGETKHIKINWLKINEWGLAQYVNQHFNSNSSDGILYGKVTEVYKNTHISFSVLEKPERRSALIIHTNGFSSTIGRFYSAVHLGVSWDNFMPNGKRFLLERVEVDFDQVQPELIELHSETYKSLPDPIRMLFSGRIKNLLGFLRQRGQIFSLKDLELEWENSIKMKDVFQDAAIMMAKRAKVNNNLEAINAMLFRAVNHGLDVLDNFEKEVAEIAPEVLKNLRLTPKYKKIEAILKSANTGEKSKGHPDMQDDPFL